MLNRVKGALHRRSGDHSRGSSDTKPYSDGEGRFPTDSGTNKQGSNSVEGQRVLTLQAHVPNSHGPTSPKSPKSPNSVRRKAVKSQDYSEEILRSDLKSKDNSPEFPASPAIRPESTIRVVKDEEEGRSNLHHRRSSSDLRGNYGSPESNQQPSHGDLTSRQSGNRPSSPFDSKPLPVPPVLFPESPERSAGNSHTISDTAIPDRTTSKRKDRRSYVQPTDSEHGSPRNDRLGSTRENFNERSNPPNAGQNSLQADTTSTAEAEHYSTPNNEATSHAQCSACNRSHPVDPFPEVIPDERTKVNPHQCVDFTHHTHPHLPVVHHDIRPEMHTRYEPVRTKSLHYHTHNYRVQPLIDPSAKPRVLPVQHYAQDHATGEVFRIPDAMGEEMDRLTGEERGVKDWVDGLVKGVDGMKIDDKKSEGSTEAGEGEGKVSMRTRL